MAMIISGKDVSQQIKERLKQEVATLPVKPQLAIVQVGARDDSNVYIRQKIKFASEVGVLSKHIQLPKSTTEEELKKHLINLNENVDVHGIIVQLPLECDNPIDSNMITNLISPTKDVDGLSDVNAGKLMHGQVDGKESYIPCTPFGCLELIKRSGIEISGSNAVVLGRSKIVGSPMAQLLLWNNATVTIVHSKTREIPSIVRNADIIVAAVGIPNFVKADWLKPGAVVIDCGITSVPDASKKSGYALIGDVDFEHCQKVARAITPVPGGVGPMTVAMLIYNTVDAAKKVL